MITTYAFSSVGMKEAMTSSKNKEEYVLLKRTLAVGTIVLVGAGLAMAMVATQYAYVPDFTLTSKVAFKILTSGV